MIIIRALKKVFIANENTSCDKFTYSYKYVMSLILKIIYNLLADSLYIYIHTQGCDASK